jgi:hypothetical protein
MVVKREINHALHNGLAPASLPPAGERTVMFKYIFHKEQTCNLP